MNTNNNSVNQLISKSVNQIKPKLIVLDEKFTKLIPDPKLKKIIYYFGGGFLGLIFLILLFGIILLPFRNTQTFTGFLLNKPRVIVSSPVPQKELNETQKKLLNLENAIKDLKFPESILNIPMIEHDINVGESDIKI